MFECNPINSNENEMPHMSLRTVAEVCGGTYVGSQQKLNCLIRGAVTDSRQIKPGYIFLPLKGAKVDGHSFIPAVFEQGAIAVLSEQPLEHPAGPYILVDSVPESMQKLARHYRMQLMVKVVGITGSVGKTSTKEMISSVLSEKFRVHKTAGNFNNEIGLPLTIFQIRPEHEIAVLEMGISDFGEMHRLSAMAVPDICVLTNIGCCHLENLHDRDGILKAKTECFSHMMPQGSIILNGDDDKLAGCPTPPAKNVVYYGKGKQTEEERIYVPEINLSEDSPERANASGGARIYAPEVDESWDSPEKASASGSARIYATDIENLGFEGIRAQIHTPEGSFPVTIPIAGEHNVYNALAATAVGLQFGMKTEEIAHGISRVTPIAGRANFLKTERLTIIDDCYNANPVSMAASLEVLSHAKGRTIAVLGDMGELGAEEKKLHYVVGEAVGKNRIDTLFAAGTLADQYAYAAKKTNPDCMVFYYPKKEEMISSLLDYVKDGDSILVKASHFMEFPEIVEQLKSREGQKRG